MRQKSAKAGAGGKKTTGGKEIVHRELKHVLTNGTVSDAAFLSGDEASHCVAIKVSAAKLVLVCSPLELTLLPLWSNCPRS